MGAVFHKHDQPQMRQFQSKVSKTRLLSLSKSANRWTSTLHQRRHRDFCCRLHSDQPRRQHLLGVNAITASRSEELMGSPRHSKGGLCHRATERPILDTVTVRVLIVLFNRPTLDSHGLARATAPRATATRPTGSKYLVASSRNNAYGVCHAAGANTSE